MQNKALMCASQVLKNSQYANDIHANKQLINRELRELVLKMYSFDFSLL